MKEKRTRAQNFTYEEKDKLIKILYQYKGIVLNKKTDAVTKKIKSAAWANITTKFNCCSPNPRTKKSLVKVWEKMKSEAKTFHNLPDSGFTESLTPEECDLVMEQVSAVLEHHNNKFVCAADHYGITDRKSPKHERNSSDEDKYPIEELSNVECVIESPNWSQEQGSHANENGFSEASSSNSSSNNLNDKILDIDFKKQLLDQELEFKKRLYEEEIEYKRKLYNLQIKAAEQDLQIKEEILARIKDGRIDINDILGSQPNLEANENEMKKL